MNAKRLSVLWTGWLGLLTALVPAAGRAELALTHNGFESGDGHVQILRDSGGAGTKFVATLNAGGAATAGTLLDTADGRFEVRLRSGFRLTNVLRTVQQFDDNGDGNIERVTFEFEAPVNNATDATGIDIGEGTGGSVLSVSADKKTITVTPAGVTGTERKTVGFTAAAGILTDDRGNPVLFWPAAGRKVTLCGTVDSKGTCYAQVEQDEAVPVLGFTAPKPLDTAVGTVNLAYTLSETVKPAADAPVTFTRVRGVADLTSPHLTNLGTQVTKGSRTLAINGGPLGLVEGSGYRIRVGLKDNADVGDPYNTFNANDPADDEVTNVIYGKDVGKTFVYVGPGATGTPDGSGSNPYPTISEGLAALPGAGGNVLVLDGTYIGSYSLGSGVKLRGVGADVTILDGAGGCVVNLDRVQDAELTGLKISDGRPCAGPGCDSLADAAVCVYGGSGIHIHNNILLSSKNGLRVRESAPRIEHNTIVKNFNHGAYLLFPEDALTRGQAMASSNVIADNGGACVYLEIPPELARQAGSIFFNNILIPAGCGSITARQDLEPNNPFSDPQLDSSLVAQSQAAIDRDAGWNRGLEGVPIPMPPTPQVVSATDGRSLLAGLLMAVLAGGTALRRKRGGKRPGGPAAGNRGSRMLLLPALLLASEAPAVGPKDPPPNAPSWGPKTAGKVFANVTFEFLQELRINLRWNAASHPTEPGTLATGYELYIGLAPRAAGSPFSAGATPYDVRNITLASIADSGADAPLTIDPTRIYYVAVMAYNQFGNESNYSTSTGALVVPVNAPIVTSVQKSTASVTLNFQHGTILASGCTGCSVRTEVWRQVSDQPDTLVPLDGSPLGPSTTSFTDSPLLEGETYEYRLRTFVDLSGVAGVDPANPFTYSEVTLRQVTTDNTQEIPFDVVLNRDERSIDEPLQADDRVDINRATGVVTFDNTPDESCLGAVVFTVGPPGLPRSTYNSNDSTLTICYNDERVCGSDPLTGGGDGHAGLYMSLGNAPPKFIGGTDPEPFSVPAATTLSFGVNDCKGSNNSRGFRVTGTIFRAR